MTPAEIGTLLQHGLLTVFWMAAPLLAAGLIVGLTVALFQALTQINEVTLVFIPKMVAIGLALWLAGPFIAERLEIYLREITTALAALGSG